MASLLSDLWRRELQPLVGWLWNCTWLWRALGLTLLSSLLFVAARWRWMADLLFRLAKRPQRLEHDIRMFRLADGVMTEENLLGFVGRLRTDTCLLNEIHGVDRFVDTISQVGNQYLDRSLKSRAATLASALSKLTNFIGDHFSVPEGAQGQLLVLCAGLKLTQPLFVDEKGKECMFLAGLVQDAYTDYRKAVKKTLLV